MHLSDELIAEFQKYYSKLHGERISAGKARKQLSDLATTVKIVSGGRKEKDE